MGKELAKKNVTQNALESMAGRLQVSKEQLYNTLKKTAFKECQTNEDFLAGLMVANTYGLNPLLKEIYMFPAKGGGIVPMVPVDGWVSMVNRSRNYDGVDLIENRLKDGETEPSGSGIASVTAIFYLKDRTHPVTVTEYMSECYAGNKEPWKRWPVRMLRHKAYIQGARIAFGFSGIYDEDETQRILDVTNISEAAKEEKVRVESLPEEGEAPVVDQKKQLMISNFNAQLTRLGEERFYELIGAHGYTSIDEVSGSEDAKKVLAAMSSAKVSK